MAVEIKVKSTLNASAYNEALASMKKGAAELNQSMGAIGGVAAGVFGGGLIQSAVSTLVGWVKRAEASFVSLGHAAENIGVSATGLDEVHDTFARFAVSGDAVNTMFGRMESARESAINGNAKAIKSFRDLGISIQELTRMNPRELFDAIAGGFAGAGGKGDASVGAENIFGRGMKRGGMRKGLRAYGEGQRFDPAVGVDEEAVSAAKAAAVKKGLALKAVENAAGNAYGAAVQKPGMGGIGRNIGELTMAGLPMWGAMIMAGRAIFGVGKKDLAENAPTSNRQKLEERWAREEAAKRTKRTQEQLDAENARHLAAQQTARNDEIAAGVRWQAAPADSFKKKGMIVGGDMGGGDMVYANARHQTELLERIARSNEALARRTTEDQTHKTNVERITGGANYDNGMAPDTGSE